MKAIIEINKSSTDSGGCRSVLTGELLTGISIREVRFLGLKILSVTETTFVTEVRLLRLPIKQCRLKGWEIYRRPLSMP